MRWFKPVSARRFNAALPLLLVCCAAVALAGCRGSAPGPADAAASWDGAPRGPLSLEEIAVREELEGTSVVISGDRPPEWTSQLRGDGTIVLHLPNSTPGHGLSGQTFDGGLVKEVQIETRVVEVARPATVISVTPWGETRHSVRAEGNALWVELTALAGRATDTGPATLADQEVPESRAPESFRAPSGEHTIGPGDLLGVHVLGLAELSQRARVQADGRIMLPIVGRVSVGGMTVPAAEKSLEHVLRERGLLTRPEVQIVVEEAGSRTVVLQGAVARPGLYELTGGDSLLEVLSRAGGTSARFDRREPILVLRQEDRGQRRIVVDSRGLLERGEPELNVALWPGDIILVPEATRHRVFVTGAVGRPGPVEFLSSEGLTVLQAITMAGGAQDRARLRRVQIVRALPEGGQTTMVVNLDRIRRGLDPDVPLESNDTIFVAESFF